MKPIILIAPEEVKNPSSSAFPFSRYITNEAYVKAIQRAGGEALMLFPSSSLEYLVSLSDGILMQGGADVDPTLYKEEKDPLTGSVNREEDLFHISLIKEAIKQNKPILGICRGLQIINVALGGTLYQDESLTKTKLEHKRLDSPLEAVHKVVIEKDSFLYRIFNKERLCVNSLHHQMIKTTGDGIRVVARAEDGNVEAIEGNNIWALQWHPEAMLMHDDTMLPLFASFIKKCFEVKNLP